MQIKFTDAPELSKLPLISVLPIHQSKRLYRRATGEADGARGTGDACAEHRTGRNCPRIRLGARAEFSEWSLYAPWVEAVAFLFLFSPSLAQDSLPRCSLAPLKAERHGTTSKRRQTLGLALEGAARWDWRTSEYCNGLSNIIFQSTTRRHQHGWLGRRPVRQRQESAAAARFGNGAELGCDSGGATPYEDLSFRRKEDKVAFPNSILLGLRKGLSLQGD